LDGGHWKSTTFLAFTTIIRTTTITYIGRSIGYWTAYGKNGDIAFFCSV
jgi:hypothetical protein